MIISIIFNSCFDIQHLFLLYNFVYTDCFIIIIQQNNNNTNSNQVVDNPQNLIENNMVKNFYCQLNFMIINI